MKLILIYKIQRLPTFKHKLETHDLPMTIANGNEIKLDIRKPINNINYETRMQTILGRSQKK